MYMRHPHDPKEWEEQKKRNIAVWKNYNAKKRKAGVDDKKDGDKRQDNKKDTLAKGFQSAFVLNSVSGSTRLKTSSMRFSPSTAAKAARVKKPS